jgi:hypothetical protein
MLRFETMQIILSSPTPEIDQCGAVDRCLLEEKRGEHLFDKHTCPVLKTLNLWDGCLISIAATGKLVQGHIEAFILPRPIGGDRDLARILAAGGLSQRHVKALIKRRPVGWDGRVVLVERFLPCCGYMSWEKKLGIVFVNQELLIALGLSGTGLATVQYALSMSSSQPIITPTMLRRQVLLLLSSTLLSLVDGSQEVSEDPLGHVPALLAALFIPEAEMDSLVDADIDRIPGQI